MAVTLNQRIASRVMELRAVRQWSIEALAERSGVSRSMISLIERGESNPTAVVLDKLATAFGITLSALFEHSWANGEAPSPLARHAEQVVWCDPDSGYRRRNLSPSHPPQSLKLVEVRFPPGRQVAFESQGQPLTQQVWILEGQMEVTAGEEVYELAKGDCLAMTLRQPVMFHNPSKKTARYLVAICPEVLPRS